MFFQVKVFDAKGDLKKVISSKRLSRKFWKNNNNVLTDYIDGDFALESMKSGPVLQVSDIKVEDLSG